MHACILKQPNTPRRCEEGKVDKLLEFLLGARQRMRTLCMYFSLHSYYGRSCYFTHFNMRNLRDAKLICPKSGFLPKFS